MLARGRARISHLAPAEVTWQQPAAAFAIGLLMPGVDYRTHTDDGTPRITVWDAQGSWAVVDRERGEQGWAVRESGPRALWAEIEQAYRRWAGWRYPSPDRFGAAADLGAMHVFLDEPARRVATVGLGAARGTAA